MIEKKKFFEINLEALETSVPLLAVRPEALENKTVKLDATKMLKGRGSEVRFIIKKVGDAMVGQIYSFSLYPSYIRRLIGHGTSIVEDSFVCEAQEVKMQIKPFLITRKKVHRSVRNALREEAKDFLEKSCAKKPSDKIFEGVLSGILQRTLSAKLKKIYPLAVCEIRVVKIIK
jgi:ribosomal protein S3AE